MRFTEAVETLQKQNPGTIVFVKNGIFFAALGKDAVALSDETRCSLNCAECPNRRDTEDDILERLRGLGK